MVHLLTMSKNANCQQKNQNFNTDCPEACFVVVIIYFICFALYYY